MTSYQGVPLIFDPDHAPLALQSRSFSFLLRSISREILWKPGEFMRGDVTTHGVFSWNCPHLCAAEALQWLSDGEEPFYVIGTVKLWGEVIEHERGYRSEFAEVASLDHVMHSQGLTFQSTSAMWDYRKQFSLPTLRKEYGV